MENTPIARLLLRLSPPVMLALLIQSVYNLVDSYFVSRYSAAGLTALSIIFPIQLLMTALATGTGAGINILISRMDGSGERLRQGAVMKSGIFLGLINYLVFAALGLLIIDGYYRLSSEQPLVRQEGICYAKIIFIGAFGQFIEANCTKILQAKGNMVTPMAAQITGAAVNVVLDPLLIFGRLGLPELGDPYRMRRGIQDLPSAWACEDKGMRRYIQGRAPLNGDAGAVYVVYNRVESYTEILYRGRRHCPGHIL